MIIMYRYLYSSMYLISFGLVRYIIWPIIPYSILGQVVVTSAPLYIGTYSKTESFKVRFVVYVKF